jgi:hypothetical protein
MSVRHLAIALAYLARWSRPGLRVSRGSSALPYASTFAAFFSRAYDFIRMAAVGRASIRLVGTRAWRSARTARRRSVSVRS